MRAATMSGQPAAEPVAEPAVEPAAEPVTEPVAEPSTDRPWWLPAEDPAPERVPRTAAPPAQPAWSPIAPVAPSWESHRAPLAFAVLLLLVVVGAYLAWPRPPASDLRPQLTAAQAGLAYRVGDIHRYAVSQKLNAIVTLPSGEYARAYSNLSAVEALRVIAVAENGDATLGLKIEKLAGDFDGRPVAFDPTRAKEIVVVLSREGRIVRGGTGGTLGGDATTQDPGSDQFSSILPTRTVRMGDSWTSVFSRPNPLGSGDMRYQTTNQFLRVDAIGGRQTAVIQTDYNVPVDMQLNPRSLLDWTGAGATLPAGAGVRYLGSGDGRVVGYFSTDSQQLRHAVDSSDFQFDLTFSGLPPGPAYQALSGKIHFGGHLESDFSALS